MHRPTGDAALIKKINTAIILDSVLKYAPISRAQISEKTGLNKATVSNLVQDLIEMDLIIEIGTGESSGGRKPVMLLFNGTAGYAAGIDLGVNYIRGVLTDLEGRLIYEADITLHSHQAEDVLARLYRCIDELLDNAPDSPYGVVGIGIGVPGIVDSEGTVLFAPNLKWHKVPLRQRVAERFNLPVTIDNEANAGAQGEQKYGAGRGIANLVYISAGTGIGTGIIIQNELYRGSNGFSGELGHISIAMDGPPCSCGNIGCWELYASEKALLELTAHQQWDSVQSVCRAAESGDPQAIGSLRTIGHYLGIGLANAINIFNPEAIIIGNKMSLAERWISDSAKSTFTQRTLPYHRDGLQLVFAEHRERSVVLGAAYFAIDAFFRKIKGNIG